MTREQAVAAGWVFSDHLGQHAQTHWVGVASIRPDNVLAAITAIERYAEAERMLEEILDVAISASNTDSQIDRGGFIQDIIDMAKAYLEGRPYERT